MKLPVARPPPIIIFEEWTQRQLSQEQPQHQEGKASQGPSRQRSTHRQQDEILILNPGLSPRELISKVCRNQKILQSNNIKVDKKLDKVKGFFMKLWQAISCSSRTSTATFCNPGKQPVFTWSSSFDDQASSSDDDGDGGDSGGQTSHSGRGKQPMA